MKPPNRVGHPFGGFGNDAGVFGVSCYPLGLNLGDTGHGAGAALTGYAALALGRGLRALFPSGAGSAFAAGARGGRARPQPRTPAPRGLTS